MGDGEGGGLRIIRTPGTITPATEVIVDVAELDALRARVAALEDFARRAGMVLWNWCAAGDDEAKLWAAIEERDYVLYTLYPRLGVERRRVFDEE